MSRGPLVPAAVACLVVGGVLMFFFELAVTRVLGVLLLVAWIVLGALAVASPEYLGREDEEDG
jgi:hypothetical protein